jgi:ATP-binding cassette subfamily F protein 3
MLINVDKISKSFQSTDVFYEASTIIKENEKIAIVGPNGSGKTTLLKIIRGEVELDSGRLIKSEKISLGYLQQMAFEDETQTVYEIFEKVFENINQIQAKVKKLEIKLKADPEDTKSLDQYARLMNQYEILGGYFIQSQMETVVSKMGFTKEEMTKKVEHFSGGQKTRLALAKLLLSYPDILILDEPTNHLDLKMIEWLEGFLISYPKAVLFVSHDRKFIDRVAQSIVAIEDKKLERYAGDYTTYVALAKAKVEKQVKAYSQQQKEIIRLEELIEKFRYKKNKAAFAQSKIKYLDRMEKVEKPKQSKQSFSVLFEPRLRGAKEVLILDQVKIGYKEVLATITCSVHKQQKIAIVGGNGVGKSTLLKSIASEIPILGGEMILGHQIEIGYFDQQLAQLNSNKTVLEEVWDDFELLNKTEIRKVLGKFLFSQDDVFKQVSACSGGEKVRLTLAKLMLKKANFLVLDEPTNHLDIEAKEALEESLKAYTGTLLFVSHDRYFVEAIADTMWYFDENGLVIQENHESILSPEQVKEQEKKQKKQTIIQQRLDKKELEKKIKRIEKQITEDETELEELREKRFDSDYYHDYLKMNELNDTIDEKHNEISHLIAEWERLLEENNQEEKDENI